MTPRRSADRIFSDLERDLDLDLDLGLSLPFFANISLKIHHFAPKFLQFVASPWGNITNFSHFRRRTNITRYITFYHSLYHAKYVFAFISVNNCLIALKFLGKLDDS